MNVSSRWLEGYLVRYFIGTIVGSICCIVVMSALSDPANIHLPLQAIANDIRLGKLDPTSFLFVSSIGFLYCYIASTPITIIHAARMLGPLPSRRFLKPASMWITWWVVTAFLIFVQLLDMQMNAPFHSLFEKTSTLLIALPALYLLFAQWAPLTAVLNELKKLDSSSIAKFFFWALVKSEQPEEKAESKTKKKEFIKFYADLAERRTANDSNDDFRTSYSHLREHSNSIFIVLLEVSLAALLTGICIIMVSSSWLARALTVSSVLLLWIMPTVYVWGIANALEGHLSEQPLPKPKPTDSSTS